MHVRKHTTVVIGTASFSIAAGESGEVGVTLNGSGRKLLTAAKSHRLSVTVIADATGGNLVKRTTTLTETLPRTKRRKKR